MDKPYEELERIESVYPPCACALTDPEMDEMARLYRGYMKVKTIFNAETYQYLTFEQYVEVFSPRPSNDWAWLDNRTSDRWRNKNGHSS